MNKSWLIDRLTAARKDAGIWRDFVIGLQDLINNHAEQYVTRLKKKVSLFDADKEDLDRMLLELGDFFALGKVIDENLPLVIMQRQDQIHQKKTIYPLVNTLVREFDGIKVSWEPLYAPIDQETYPYGSKFIIEREIAQELIPRDKWFMTSRGVIRVPMLEVRRVFGKDMYGSDEAVSDFEALLKRVIYPLIPLRIVCDGQQYYLSFDIAELLEYMFVANSSISTITPDAIEADESNILDSTSIKTLMPMMDNEREKIPYPVSNRLDAFACDALSIDKYLLKYS